MSDHNVIGYEVCEFYGTGDPFFGGNADDRMLGKDGQFLRSSYAQFQVARFDSRDAAKDAADKANNRRNGGRIGIMPVRDWSKR